MNITMHKKTRILFAPVIKFMEWLGVKHPKTLIQIRYFARFHKFPNLKNPRTVNEKILWMKLNSDITIWTKCADKFEVREYVKSCGLENYLVKLYGHYTNPKDFNLEVMPQKFILKANNGTGKGEYHIVKDKSLENVNNLRSLMQHWLSIKNAGSLSADVQYYNIKPQVIAEELLSPGKGETSLIDYKIWCFNGKPYYIFVYSERKNDKASIMIYDTDWKPMPEVYVFNSDRPQGEIIPKPKNFDEMLRIAEKLSHPFPQVRIDLYNIDGRIYFGETTFSAVGGMMDYLTPEFLVEMGDKIDLNYKG